jgi:putative IMPACT (imprinted ancient) family translation regulator
MLEGQQLINVCVGVIRYYGGVNLGTGGLARAYGGTAKMAMQAAKIVDFVEMQEISVTVDYNQLDTLLHAVAQHKGVVLDKAFDSRVCVKIKLPEQQSQALLTRFG